MASKRLTGEITLDDPGALKALAHPARLAIVDELYQGFERTASELADLAGLSPSAMSYHLRALERWGIVERGEAREDGRERPWRALARTLRFDPETISTAATDVVAATTFQHLREAFRHWAAVEREQPKVWRDLAGVGRSYLWLTEEEAQAFSGELDAVVKKYAADRDAAHHPEGTRRVFCLVATSPRPNSAPEPAAARLRLLPLGARGQAAGLACPLHAFRVCVSPRRAVALREEQDVVGHRCEAPAAQRTGVRGGLQILRAPELPPARSAHFFFVAVSGHFAPRDFSSRHERIVTLSPDRARTTLMTSLDTRARYPLPFALTSMSTISGTVSSLASTLSPATTSARFAV